MAATAGTNTTTPTDIPTAVLDETTTKISDAIQPQSQEDKSHSVDQLEQQVKSKLDLSTSPTQEQDRLVGSHDHLATQSPPVTGSITTQAQPAADKQVIPEHVEQHVQHKSEAGEVPSKVEARLADPSSYHVTDRPAAPTNVPAESKTTADKHASLEQAEHLVKSKLDSGIAPTQEEARIAESQEHKIIGHLPESGSTIAKAQAAADKTANFEGVARQVKAKMQADPASITLADAAHLESREARAIGHRPPADSLSAEAKRVAAGGGHPIHAPPTKEQEFQQAVNVVAPKIDHEPEHVTQEDASLLHSADRRAHGKVEKGGVTAQAQHLAAENKTGTKP